jgi:PAS domain S-box-containing protein
MVAGAVVGAIGVVVLAGWILGATLLTSVVPGLPAMKPNTALSFVLLGAAIVLLARTPAPPWARVVRRLAAAIALLIGAVTLLDYATDMNLGIGHVLVHDALGAGGRMPPVTALGLLTGAAAFLLLDIGHAGALAQILALATGMLGFLNLVGYAYSLHRLRELSGYTAVSLHTALSLVVVSVGILLARPDRGLMRMAQADTPAGVVVRRLLPVVIGAPFVLGWVVDTGRRAGLYGPEFSMALSVVGTVAALSGVVWAAASALQRADVRRRRAETALQRADAEVGRVVARTVELADANKALVEMTARLRTLDRLNRLVSSSLDFEAVLVAIARAACDITATPVVSFWLADEAARTVTVRAWSDAAAGADFPTTRFAFGEGAVGTVAATRQAVHVPDVFASGAGVRALEWCARHGLRSFDGVPVLAQDRLLAVLALSRRAPLALAEDDQEMLGSFVAQAAVAIDNARLFTEAQHRRRLAEAAEARYRGLFERNLAGIFRSTQEGRLVDCNDAMVRILGHASRDDLLARRIDDFAVDAADRERAILPVRPGERLSNAELRWRRADGTPITVLVSVGAIESDDGSVALEGIVVDITDRERAAAAEREAEALRAVAKLANAAAHEINNPLAVILGHLDLLARHASDDSETAQRIDRAQTACRRIAEMITHMSRITRLEEYEQSPNLPPILDLRRSSSEGDPS